MDWLRICCILVFEYYMHPVSWQQRRAGAFESECALSDESLAQESTHQQAWSRRTDEFWARACADWRRQQQLSVLRVVRRDSMALAVFDLIDPIQQQPDVCRVLLVIAELRVSSSLLTRGGLTAHELMDTFGFHFGGVRSFQK